MGLFFHPEGVHGAVGNTGLVRLAAGCQGQGHHHCQQQGQQTAKRNSRAPAAAAK